ncbi:MAG: thioredoxin family protein [Chitinophagaceae bacterium]
MTFEAYLQYFQSILNNGNPAAPYDNPDYFNYTKLNWSRMNRWLKTAVLSDEIKDAAAKIVSTQHWIVITEPWCGDAAHIVPFIEMIAQLNSNITLTYELRDSEPFRINDYLTNGKSKSIPKLIIQNKEGKNMAVWGPRPAACQVLYDELMERKADFETLKTELQHWYNKNEGREIMVELSALISQANNLP